MAFGFFRKTETADLIFHNGHIFTQDPQLPWAEAVACKGEKILGVGNLEGMDSVIGKDTRLVDLDGKYLLPGFIDVHRSPVLKVFEGKFLDLSECSSTEEVLEAVAAWADENPDEEIVFGYGYRDDLKPNETEIAEIDDEAAEADEADETGEFPAVLAADTEAERAAETEIEAESDSLGIAVPMLKFTDDIAKAKSNQLPYAKSEALPQDSEFEKAHMTSADILSEVCGDRPVLLLCANGIECWTNNAADEIIISTADDEYVQTITTAYVLNLLIPFDFEQVEEDVRNEIEALADSGFTTVLNLGMPDYFENLYQDSLLGLYNEGQLRQRFFGSYYVNRPLRPEPLVHKLMTRRTTCLELNGLLNAKTLNVYLCGEESPVPFTQNALNKILEEVCDKGFDIFIEAINYDDMLMAYDALEHIRAKGYKNVFTIASDFELSDEERSERPVSSEALKTWGTNLLSDRSIYGHMSSAEEVIDQLTVEAAKIIGMQDSLGSIEAGKLADFAIFDENPLDCEVKLIPRLHASMTVLAGEIVYDAENENDMEMFNLMMSQQF